MGLILAGILVGAIFVGLIIWHNSASENPIRELDTLLIILAAAAIISGTAVGIIEPVSGYEEPKIASTTELVSLRDEVVSEGEGRLFYVSISGTNSYTYYVEEDSPYLSGSQKAYKSKTISNSNVTIIEDNDCVEAKLVTYVKHGKKTFWTFAAGAKKYEYVFYVPVGTIARDVSLG